MRFNFSTAEYVLFLALFNKLTSISLLIFIKISLFEKKSTVNNDVLTFF